MTARHRSGRHAAPRPPRERDHRTAAAAACLLGILVVAGVATTHVLRSPGEPEPAGVTGEPTAATPSTDRAHTAAASRGRERTSSAAPAGHSSTPSPQTRTTPAADRSTAQSTGPSSSPRPKPSPSHSSSPSGGPVPLPTLTGPPPAGGA